MAKQRSNLTRTGLHEFCPLDWLSERVEEAVREVTNPDLARGQHAILERMKTDKRMKNVWSLLLSRKRPSRKFVYPVIQRNDTGQKSDDERQFEALREIFYFVFCAARDEMKVSRPIEIKQNKENLTENATTLRLIAHDLDLAAASGRLGIVDTQDKLLAAGNSGALRCVANWLDHLSSALRRPDDPLMVKRHRGDSVIRGVQRVIAVKMEELFGDRLDRTTATLTSVALGKRASAKTTRSAPKRGNFKLRA